MVQEPRLIIEWTSEKILVSRRLMYRIMADSVWYWLKTRWSDIPKFLSMPKESPVKKPLLWQIQPDLCNRKNGSYLHKVFFGTSFVKTDLNGIGGVPEIISTFLRQFFNMLHCSLSASKDKVSKKWVLRFVHPTLWSDMPKRWSYHVYVWQWHECRKVRDKRHTSMP